MSYIVCDLEADNLLHDATTIWCLCAVDDKGKEYEAVGHKSILELANIVNTYDTSVWHNSRGYDKPLLKKILGVELKNDFDTLICSQVLDPDRPQGHGIAAWGEYFGRPKPEHEEWDRFSEEMLHRCKEDVQIGLMLYKHLMSKMEGWDWEKAIKLEHDVMHWHSIQVDNGVLFDHDKATKLCFELKSKIEEADVKMNAVLPYICHKGDTVSKVFKKNGEPNAYVEKYFGWDVGNVCGEYSKVSFEKVDTSSAKQVKDYFLSIGWKPTEYTDKGSPKLTEDSFDSLPEGTPAKLLAERRVWAHRLAQVEGLMGRVRKDGRIASEAFTCGSVTGRYRHQGIANLPRVTSPYGHEMRDLFIVPDNRIMIGSDLGQIEARVLGHYLYPYDSGATARELLEGDVHQAMADFAGVDRNTAKTIRYAIMYGCAASNLGSKVGVSVKEGKRLHKAFWDANMPLKKLNDDLLKVFKRRGFIKGLDGRKLMIRSEHALLNSLLQAGATVVFKTGLVMINEELTRRGIDYKQLIAYHDEVQLEVNGEDKEEVANVVLQSWEKAGKMLGIKVPIVGETKYGRSWSETH